MRTASLALILKMYHANSSVNRMYSQGRKLTTVKHKCYAKITMQYILNIAQVEPPQVYDGGALAPHEYVCLQTSWVHCIFSLNIMLVVYIAVYIKNETPDRWWPSCVVPSLSVFCPIDLLTNDMMSYDLDLWTWSRFYRGHFPHLSWSEVK